jgi:exodeoxyribonuclease VII large subunit
VVLAPTPVQGAEAAIGIAEAVRRLNAEPGIDVIIVARGGGSMEELWPFNEEIVARAIFASGVPIVSAVGHETDYTISDYVADKRAPTPSAAAEMVAPDRLQVSRQVEGLMLGSAMVLRNRLRERTARVERSENRLAVALPDTGRLRERLVSLVRHASSVLGRSLDQRMQVTNARALQLRSLDPRATLARGYAVVQLREGKQAITSVHQVKGKDRLDVHVKDGKFPAEVSRQYGF